jgi:hypothetical protein
MVNDTPDVLHGCLLPLAEHEVRCSFEIPSQRLLFSFTTTLQLGVSKWMDWMDLDWIANGWIKIIHLSINNPSKFYQKNPIQSIH